MVSGAAAKAAEAGKHRVLACDGTSGYSFVPFANDSYGRLGSGSLALLNAWGTPASSGGFYKQTVYFVWIKRELSVALIKGNARMLTSFVGVLAQGIARWMVHCEEFTAYAM
jgi:hypothetical protein